MKRLCLLACVLAGTITGFAAQQDTMWPDRTAGSKEFGVSKTEPISITTYEKRLRDSYVKTGLPESLITQILPIDVDIYNAHVSGDNARVLTLTGKRTGLLTPTYQEKVHTYFVDHPFVVNHGSGTFTVWDGAAKFEGGKSVSASGFERQMRLHYTSLGLPENITAQLLQTDMEIYDAHKNGDLRLAERLLEKEAKLLTPEQNTKVNEFFKNQPFHVKISDSKSFLAWQKPAEVKTGTAGTMTPPESKLGGAPGIPGPAGGRIIDKKPAVNESLPATSSHSGQTATKPGDTMLTPIPEKDQQPQGEMNTKLEEETKEHKNTDAEERSEED